MGSFDLGGMTFGSLFKKPETTRYPYETKVKPKGLKGHIENNVDNCILCAMCQKSCPCDAISIDKEAKTWTINPFQCIQCSSCVRACPKSCLVMIDTYTPVSTKKYVVTLDVGDHKKPPADDNTKDNDKGEGSSKAESSRTENIAENEALHAEGDEGNEAS